jgi:hypothetical protein
MTLTATFPVPGLGKGRDVVQLSVAHAFSSMSAFSACWSRLYGS